MTIFLNMSELPVPIPQGSLSVYLAEINRFPLLSSEEEHELATRYQDSGDIEAAHKLVTSNLRFVVKVANEYNSYGMRLADLIQEGNMGLMMAVKKFDPRKGFRLISYAVWWIRATIQNYILKSWSLVKIGTTQAQRKLFYKLRQTKRALAHFLSDSEVVNEAGYQSLAKSLNVRTDEVIEMDTRLQARDSSLDQPLNEESSATQLDMLVAPEGQTNQEELFCRMEEGQKVRTEVQQALTCLNDKEKFIIESRLMSDQPLTLQEIGERYKISRERVRQLEERAKQKIRIALTNANLVPISA